MFPSALCRATHTRDPNSPRLVIPAVLCNQLPSCFRPGTHCRQSHTRDSCFPLFYVGLGFSRYVHGHLPCLVELVAVCLASCGLLPRRTRPAVKQEVSDVAHTQQRLVTAQKLALALCCLRQEPGHDLGDLGSLGSRCGRGLVLLGSQCSSLLLLPLQLERLFLAPLLALAQLQLGLFFSSIACNVRAVSLFAISLPPWGRTGEQAGNSDSVPLLPPPPPGVAPSSPTPACYTLRRVMVRASYVYVRGSYLFSSSFPSLAAR